MDPRYAPFRYSVGNEQCEKPLSKRGNKEDAEEEKRGGEIQIEYKARLIHKCMRSVINL